MAPYTISRILLAMYIVFLVVSIAGIVSFVSGIALWIAPEGGYGYRGGGGEVIRRRSDSTTDVDEIANLWIERSVLGLDRAVWKNIHIYSSLLCIVAVLIHILFNWKWIVSVTRVVFRG